MKAAATLKEIISEHRDYHQQIIKMAQSDLRKTYRASALGWAWAVIRPVVTILVYWCAMVVGFKKGKSIGEYPYFLWLISGLVPWFFMSDMLTLGTDCMRKNRHLITKMSYPVSTIPTFTAVSKMFINVILMVIVIIFYCLMGFYPTIYYLQILFYGMLSFMFFDCWATFAAPISAISQDFSNLVRSIVFAVFWLSGILWNIDTIENPIIRVILKINPVTYLVTGFRASLMSRNWFFETPRWTLVFLAELIIMFFLGLWSYGKLRKEIPDVL